jgi:hypothetical protein
MAWKRSGVRFSLAPLPRSEVFDLRLSRSSATHPDVAKAWPSPAGGDVGLGRIDGGNECGAPDHHGASTVGGAEREQPLVHLLAGLRAPLHVPGWRPGTDDSSGWTRTIVTSSSAPLTMTGPAWARSAGV